MIRARTQLRRADVPRLVLLTVVTFAATSASAAGVDDEAAQPYYRSPEFEATHLSPDGEWIVFLRQDGGRQWIMVQRTSGADLRSLFGVAPPLERVRHCVWTGPTSLACGIGKSVRRRGLWIEEARLHLFELRAGTHLVAPPPRDPVADRVIDTFPDDGSTLLLVHDEKGDGFPEVSRVDLATGARRRVVAPRPPVRHWVSDGRGSVRLGLALEKGSANVFVRDAASGELKLLIRQELADPQAFGPLGFGSNTDELYAIRLYDGRYSLFHVDLARGGALSLMYSDPVYDVLGPLDLARGTRELLGVRYVATYPRSHFFDSTAAAGQGSIDEQLPGSVNYVLERSRDGVRQLVWSESDVDPPTLYLFDTRQQILRPVGHLYPELERRYLARTRPLTYRSRDGQVIPAYLTLPTGQPVGLPAIVLVHGGPDTRDYWRFDPLVQFLAAEGYAVLQANFRGSAGYGADFLAAGAGHWGSTVHNDITDGARWLADEGYADPRRICILGRSFGGYAAMLGAVRESSVYRCAASFAGVSDLVALAEFKERFEFADVWRARIGTDRSVLAQMSPLSLAHLTGTPLLLMHGPDDAVVPVSQSRRFAAELERAGKDHLYLELSECDHDMTADACRRTVFEALAAFLKHHLHENGATGVLGRRP